VHAENVLEDFSGDDAFVVIQMMHRFTGFLVDDPPLT